MSDGTYIAPEHGWTCFHCGETFLAPVLARGHFGGDIDAEPACRIARSDRKLVGTIRYLEDQIRELEAELANYRDEDGPKDREMMRLRGEHVEALTRAEEIGFARGVADMRRHGWRLNEERERPDLYPATA